MDQVDVQPHVVEGTPTVGMVTSTSWLRMRRQGVPIPLDSARERTYRKMGRARPRAGRRLSTVRYPLCEESILGIPGGA